METAQARQAGADLLAVGFGTTVAMWALGYVSRVPPALVPAPLLGVAMLAALAAGGFVIGRTTGRGWRGGAWAGLLAAGLNLLVLGSLLSGDQINTLRPGAGVFVPGFLVAGAGLGALGAVAGARTGATRRRERDWTSAFATIAACATLLLVIVGGLVTSKGAGLAVVDWPNSFGYNMFLYPLSRMTGGIYYEHAHRLFGSLVGLTTLVLAIHLVRSDGRRWLRRLAIAAFLLVVVQGLLGGLRVTGRFTLSTDAAAMAPSTGIAVVHGVLGQLFFATVVALAVFTSATWKSDRAPRVARGAGSERTLSLLLLVALVGQLVLGALQRHLAEALLVHITLAAVVTMLAVIAGARAWGLYPGEPILARLGKVLVGLVGLQLVLGVAALVAKVTRPVGVEPVGLDVLVRTAHQATGALLLASAVMLVLWTRRLLSQT